MNRDKKLYNLMIKNHPTIIGWFFHKGIVGKNDDKLYIIDNNNEEEKLSPTFPNENNYQVYHTYHDGVRRINAGRWDKAFSQINLNYKIKGYSFETLIDAGFPIFDIGNTSERFCFTHQIEDIINKFPDLVLDIYIPEDYKRLKGKSIENFMRFAQNQIDFVRSNDNLFKGYYSFNYGFIGQQIGFSDNAPEKIANIDKHGIFANKHIYKYLEWDFDMVEKYKDLIMWEELINESNLIWSDEMLTKYEKYIPFGNPDADTYCGRFKVELDYTKFGFLGNNFLDTHKDVLDWMKVFAECKFEWTAEELTYFSEYALAIDLPYSDSFRSTTASSQMEYYQSRLISNKHFKWNPCNLLSLLLSNDYNWKVLVDGYRPELFEIFLSIPNIREIAIPHVKDIKNFWEIVTNPHSYPYDELTPEFTIDNIQKNIERWSEVIENKFLTMRRTPDTNYHYYLVITQWDIYRNRKNIPLTYPLAKYLSKIDIKLGGTYMESDGGYMEEDHRFPVYNGLEAFSSHHIDTKQDIENILEDENIANILFDYNHSINMDLLYYAIGIFFKDYPLKEYLNVINQLKDWDVVKEYYGDEEEYNSFNDKDWNELINSIML